MGRFFSRWALASLCLLVILFTFYPREQFRKIEVTKVKECDLKDLKCFGLGSTISEMRTASRDKDLLWSSRQKLVVKAFQHAWSGYSKYAFGYDEYYPMEKRGENFVEKGFGFTIIDSMDTMILMGLVDEYEEALNWVKTNLTFDQPENLNVFETTIRVFGGLLSSYFLTGSESEILLEKAKDLGQRLSLGFETSSGIPIPTINIGTGRHSYESLSSTAEATTLQLENKFLSHLTGNPRYWGLSQRVNEIVDKLPKLDGLVPIYLSISSGSFSGSEIRLGSRGDSYYEYLLKQWLQTNNNQPEFRRQYDQAVYGIKKWLVGYSHPRNLTFIGEIDLYYPPLLSPKMDHLVCFLPGNLALGATEGVSLRHSNGTLALELSEWDLSDLELAERLAEGCWYTYTMNPTGLATEITVFNTNVNKTKDAYIKPADTHNLLRPETIESLFIMWRVTKNPKYREWGWEMFQAFEKNAKVENGYISLSDVTVTPPMMGSKMETFFLAETLKYFYLLFSDDNFLSLDKVVFNTEAHPLPRFTPSDELLNYHFHEVKEEEVEEKEEEEINEDSSVDSSPQPAESDSSILDTDTESDLPSAVESEEQEDEVSHPEPVSPELYSELDPDDDVADREESIEVPIDETESDPSEDDPNLIDEAETPSLPPSSN